MKIAPLVVTLAWAVVMVGACASSTPDAAAGAPPISHECAADIDTAEGWSDYEAISGCRCDLPTAEHARSPGAHDCDPFPCTLSGCYVQKCKSPADCAAGICSAHTSPTGYCLVSDYE